MTTEVRDYVSVSEKLQKFGLAVPGGLAILPDNLATANSIEGLRQQVESDTVRTLLRVHNIAHVEIFAANNQPPYVQQYASEWFGPTLFISASLLSNDPNALSVILGLITSYLYDLFKGGDKGNKASLNVVFQRADGSCKEVHYSGPPDGLREVADLVRELAQNP